MPDIDIAPSIDTLALPLERIDDYSKLDDADKALIYQLHRVEKTQTEIALIVGCSQSAVSRWLKRLNPTDEVAKSYAHNLALKAVLKLETAMDAASDQGKSGPMDSILKIAGVLGDESQGPKVIVQIGVKDSDVQVQIASTTIHENIKENADRSPCGTNAIGG